MPENEFENGDIPEDNLPEEPPKYEDLVVEEPERPVKLAEIEVSKDDAGDMDGDDVVTRTDLQAAMNAITPKFKSKRMNEILGPIMVSDVLTDQYLDYIYFVSMSLIEEEEGNEDVDILGILTGVNVAISKAYQKRHVFDILEIAGVAHEEEMERLSKEILGS